MKVVSSGRGDSNPAIRHAGVSAQLGFEIPQSTVQRVARAARWQKALQRVSIDTRFDVRSNRLDLLDHARRIVVLEVEHPRGLAATQVRATLQGDQDHFGGRHAVTGDVERLLERIAPAWSP